MADTMQFDLVSPERRLMSGEVTSVLIPGAEGDLTIMANHAPLITTLRPGIMTVERAEVDKALGEVEMATYSTNTLVADDSVNVPDDSTRYALGMGYSLLQGNASVSGKTVMPFVLAVELAAGEQSFGDTGGLYLSGGISTQVHWKKYWGALGIRQFNLDENAQPLINSEWGIQWDIQLGFWF